MGRNVAEMESELREARERAERAEHQLAALKDHEAGHAEKIDSDRAPGGLDALRQDAMMAHLMEALEAGKDIGHYGRLVFAMVARYFLSDEELMEWLRKDRDFDEHGARALLRQAEGRDYNPPRRERILAWQAEQEFPIVPNADDPDCGNVYRTLKFPDRVYEHIQEYQEEKAEAESSGPSH